MSQENVEIVRRMYGLASRGDAEGLGALVAPDHECVPASDEPAPEPFRGRTAFIEYAQDWLEAFDQYVVEPSEHLDLGEYRCAATSVSTRLRTRSPKA